MTETLDLHREVYALLTYKAIFLSLGYSKIHKAERTIFNSNKTRRLQQKKKSKGPKGSMKILSTVVRLRSVYVKTPTNPNRYCSSFFSL